MTNGMPKDSAFSTDRWGVVLSGGNGMRLREFVYHKRTDYLPKQYLNFIGKRSMLEHTWHRAEKLISKNKLLTVIAKEHLLFDEVHWQTASRPQGCVIIQPENKDTGAGILLPLLHIHKRDPAAVIALFPSDHFVLEEDVFMKQVERAFRIVELDNTRIVLLGTVPDEPDPEYGYIIPGEQLGNPGLETRKVEMFVEKPSTDAAKMIMSKGALWNTLIIVVTSATLLQAIKSAAPALFRSFEPILDAIGTPDERRVVERVYQKLPSLNFSRAVLEALAHENRQNLRVLPVQGVNWKDWGSGTRLVATLRQLGVSDLAIPEAPAAQPETFSMAAKDNVIALRRRS